MIAVRVIIVRVIVVRVIVVRVIVVRVKVILIDLHDVFRSDLLTSFIKCGICSALADWLQPLPDHSLPHMKIREGILDALGTVSSTITSTCNRL